MNSKLYCLSAMIAIARRQRGNDGYVQLRGLAREITGDARVGEGGMQSLVRAGLLKSQRGPHGGARLAHPASKITLAHIMKALDGGDKDEFESSIPEVAYAQNAIRLSAREAMVGALGAVTLEAAVQAVDAVCEPHPAAAAQ